MIYWQWSNIDDKDNTIQQQKVKVVYLPQRDQDLPEEDEVPSSFANDSVRCVYIYFIQNIESMHAAIPDHS